MSDFRLKFSGHLQDRDAEALGGLLAEDVLVRLGVHDMPVRGAALVRGLVHVFLTNLREVQVQKEIVEGQDAAVIFTGNVDGRHINGVTLLCLNEQQRVSELTIFLRPLGAVAVAAEVVMVHIAQQLIGAASAA